MITKIILFILFLLGSFIFAAAQLKYRCLDNIQICLFAGGIVSPFFGFIAWILSYQEKKRMNYVITSIMFGSMFAAGITIFLNGYFDSSIPANHQVPVFSKYSTRKKSSTTYYLTLASWRPNHQSEEIKVNRDLYERVVPEKSKILLQTKAGFLGFEWLVNYAEANR